MWKHVASMNTMIRSNAIAKKDMLDYLVCVDLAQSVHQQTQRKQLVCVMMLNNTSHPLNLNV